MAARAFIRAVMVHFKQQNNRLLKHYKMKTQISLAILLLTCFLMSNLYAQQIDSLAMIPTNPTISDTIKIIGYTSHPYSDCPLTSSSVDFDGDTIIVRTSHTLGGWTALCNSIDTLTIKFFNAGTYEIRYHLSDTAPPTTYDIDTLIFTVQQPSGLQIKNNIDQKINIYPNPTTTEITIDLITHSTSGHKIDFYSVLGQKIKTFNTETKTINIDISDLTEDIYLITITNRDGRLWTGKLIKYAP